MKKSMIRFALLSVLSVTPFARASVLAKLDLETRVQQKYLSVVRAIDPRAQVLVNVTFQEAKAELPGVGLSVSGVVNEQRFDWEDVASVKVIVQSSLKPFPASLETILRKQILVGVRGLDLTIEPMAADLLALGNPLAAPSEGTGGGDVSTLFEAINQRMDRLLNYFSFGLPGALLLYALFAFGRIFAAGRHVSRGTDSLAQAIRETKSADGEEMGGRLPTATTNSSEGYGRAASNGDPTQDQVVRELGRDSLVALLADCYWSELDGYARYLWTRMSFEQRGEVMRAWSPAMSYAASFSRAETVDLGFHQHPYYVSPACRAEGVSNADLAAWVRQDKSAWHQLSPIRKAHASLGLRERLECAAAPARAATLAPPKASPSRQFSNELQMREITADDERYVLANLDAMKTHIAEIPSLVWLRLLDDEGIRTLLARYSVLALAEAWIGPEDFLHSLEGLMPERKVQRLREVRAKTPIRRDGEVLREILQEVSERTPSSAGGEDDLDRAA